MFLSSCDSRTPYKCECLIPFVISVASLFLLNATTTVIHTGWLWLFCLVRGHFVSRWLLSSTRSASALCSPNERDKKKTQLTHATHTRTHTHTHTHTHKHVQVHSDYIQMPHPPSTVWDMYLLTNMNLLTGAHNESARHSHYALLLLTIKKL